MSNGDAIRAARSAREATNVAFSGQSMTLTFADGRSVKVPLDLYPSLRDATRSARQEWRLVGRGYGIHWSKLDLDLRTEHILNGIGEGFPAPPSIPTSPDEPAVGIAKAAEGWVVVRTTALSKTLRSRKQAARAAKVWARRMRRSMGSESAGRAFRAVNQIEPGVAKS